MGFSLSEMCLTLLCIQDASHHKKWQFVQMVITYSLINTEDLCEELEIFVSLINFFFFFLAGWSGEGKNYYVYNINVKSVHNGVP